MRENYVNGPHIWNIGVPCEWSADGSVCRGTSLSNPLKDSFFFFLWQAIFLCISLSSYFIWLYAKPHDEQGKVSRKIYGHRTSLLKNILDRHSWGPHRLSRDIQEPPYEHPELNGAVGNLGKWKLFRNLSFQKDNDLSLLEMTLILDTDFSFPPIFVRNIICK